MQRRLDALKALAAKDLDPINRQRLVQLLSKGRSYHYLGLRQGSKRVDCIIVDKLGITELMFETRIFELT